MLPERLRVLYLHGFASSPHSRKARFFVERLEKLGFQVDIPDLAEGNFKNLTISGQLRLLDRLAQNERVILIGSSLGGYVASLYAARHPEVEKLILLAPAFRFSELWTSQLAPEQLATWKANGSVNVYHYGDGRTMPIGYQLIEDATQFEPWPDVRQPVLIFHGNRDASVPVQYSIEFAESHKNTKLVRVESGHELTDVLDGIWDHSEKFLLAGQVKIEC
ncbi:MAG: alpha/beta fold hydrolase [Acidobacteriota bacterium]|nr:alpha/beta fold hydrolase [Acidobacteriota bacterium]